MELKALRFIKIQHRGKNLTNNQTNGMLWLTERLII